MQKLSASKPSVQLKYYLFTILTFCCIGCQSTKVASTPDKKERQINSKIRLIQTQLDHGKALKAQFGALNLLKLYPDEPKVLTIFALTDLALKNNERALTNLTKSFELNKDAPAALNLSSANIALGHYDKALEIINHGLELAHRENYKNIVRLYHNKAFIQEKMNQKTAAVNTYKKGLYHSPGYQVSLKRLAVLLANLNRDRESIETYQQYINVCNACYDPIEKLVKLHVSNKNFNSAATLIKFFISNPAAKTHDKLKAKKLFRQLKKKKKLAQKHHSGTVGPTKKKY